MNKHTGEKVCAELESNAQTYILPFSVEIYTSLVPTNLYLMFPKCFTNKCQKVKTPVLFSSNK